MVEVSAALVHDAPRVELHDGGGADAHAHGLVGSGLLQGLLVL